MHLDLEEADAIWHRYAANRSAADRELLIARYTPFATMIAAKAFSDRQIREAAFDDFRQFAMVGLIEAIDRFDPGVGAPFQSYASHRVRGAILNGIESFNEKQQQISARTRLCQERSRELIEQTLASEADPFDRLVDVAIGTAIGFLLEGTGLYQDGSEACEHNIYKKREIADLSRVLQGLINSLNEQEQRVIRYHYQQHQRFDWIAEHMGLTKGRISQIHHRALERLRHHYDHLNLLRTDY